MNDISHLKLWLVLLLTLTSISIWGAKPVKDVVIDDCTDTYVFMSNNDGKPIVKNTVTTLYRSLSLRNINIQPYTLYGEFISLDKASGKGAAQYRNATPENVFYDDTKVCFFNINFDRKRHESKVKFERTFKDVRYFTRIYLSEDFKIKHKTVVIRIPKQFNQFKLIHQNFTPNIKFEQTEDANDRVYTYTITDMEGMVSENAMPPMASIYPYISIVGAFSDYQDMYKWSNELTQIDTNIPNLPTILKEIGQGAKTDEDRIRNTYAWVQKNIRYVAFEAGITGHQPDRPAEVVRKCYGDCKGMAMLLCTLLKAQKMDARLVDIGTEDIPFKASDMPTLGAVNHMICMLSHGGKTYWLDATNRFIPATHIPGNIQGREAMVENGANCTLMTLPILNSNSSVDSLSYHYTLEMNNQPRLVGRVSNAWCGDMKEFFMRTHDATQQGDKLLLLANAMNSDDHAHEITDVKWTVKDRREPWAILEGKIINRTGVQQADHEVYVELNPHNDLFSQRIDTTDRTHDVMLPLRCRIVREVSVQLPAGCKVMIPPSKKFDMPQGTMECTFTKKDNCVILRRVLTIHQRLLPKADIMKWNNMLGKWNDACNEQLVITNLN